MPRDDRSRCVPFKIMTFFFRDSSIKHLLVDEPPYKIYSWNAMPRFGRS